MPTAEELFSDGVHLATNAYERGNSQLGRENSRAWDLGLRKTAGDTTWGVSLYRHQVDGYIYGRTLDVHDGFQLLEYSQADARFTGLEAELRHRFNATWALRLWGDAVRAERADGTRLPRIPPARLGAQLHASWQDWKGNVEWCRRPASRAWRRWSRPHRATACCMRASATPCARPRASRWSCSCRGAT
jgi:iron complex outermembrane receptor protein